MSTLPQRFDSVEALEDFMTEPTPGLVADLAFGGLLVWRWPRLAWLQVLREPEMALGWSLAEWERTIRLARRLRLLARLAESLLAAGLMERVPRQVRRHLLAEQRLSRWRTGALLWSLERVAAMLQIVDPDGDVVRERVAQAVRALPAPA